MSNKVNINRIRKEMANRTQWICWEFGMRDGKETKIPKRADGNGFAKCNDADTWTGSGEAKTALFREDFDGIGYVFTEDDPFVGVDLDDCRDPETEEWDDWALDVMDDLGGWIEISPSGTGAHVIVKGTIPGNKNRKGNLEMYETNRFFTITGDLVDESGDPLDEDDETPEINENQQGIDVIYDRFLADDNEEANEVDVKIDLSGKDHLESTNTSTTSNGMSQLPKKDQDIVKKAKGAKNGYKFTQLWRGNWSAVYDGAQDSHSEGDMGFCDMLAFWCSGDPEQIDRIFRASGLMRPKWDSVRYSDGSTYGERTIEKAIAQVDSFYDDDHYEELVEENSTNNNDNDDDNDRQEADSSDKKKLDKNESTESDSTQTNSQKKVDNSARTEENPESETESENAEDKTENNESTETPKNNDGDTTEDSRSRSRERSNDTTSVITGINDSNEEDKHTKTENDNQEAENSENTVTSISSANISRRRDTETGGGDADSSSKNRGGRSRNNGSALIGSDHLEKIANIDKNGSNEDDQSSSGHFDDFEFEEEDDADSDSKNIEDGSEEERQSEGPENTDNSQANNNDQVKTSSTEEDNSESSETDVLDEDEAVSVFDDLKTDDESSEDTDWDFNNSDSESANPEESTTETEPENKQDHSDKTSKNDTQEPQPDSSNEPTETVDAERVDSDDKPSDHVERMITDAQGTQLETKVSGSETEVIKDENEINIEDVEHRLSKLEEQFGETRAQLVHDIQLEDDKLERLYRELVHYENIIEKEREQLHTLQQILALVCKTHQEPVIQGIAYALIQEDEIPEGDILQNESLIEYLEENPPEEDETDTQADREDSETPHENNDTNIENTEQPKSGNSDSSGGIKSAISGMMNRSNNEDTTEADNKKEDTNKSSRKGISLSDVF